MSKKTICIAFVLMSFVLMSCGEKNADQPYFDRGLGTGDLRIIPMMTLDGEAVFVDTGTGEELPNLGRWGKASLFYEGWSIVSDSTGKLFFMDKKGKLLNEDRPYHDAIPFSDGVAWVMEDLEGDIGASFGVVDTDGLRKNFTCEAIDYKFPVFVDDHILMNDFGTLGWCLFRNGPDELAMTMDWGYDGSENWDEVLVCNDERVDNKYRFLNNQ